MSKISLGFVPSILLVPLDQILPSRKTPADLITSVKFKQIRASIEDIGLIEPLSISEADKTSGQHMLLDGHVRLIVVKELEYEVVPCLVATDDES